MKTDLRKYAYNKPCQIRLPGCIDGPGHETTVLCHWRDSSTGMGQKENDLLGAWGCKACHDAVDGRRKMDGYLRNRWDEEKAHLEAIIRTQKELIKDGIIKW